MCLTHQNSEKVLKVAQGFEASIWLPYWKRSAKSPSPRQQCISLCHIKWISPCWEHTECSPKDWTGLEVRLPYTTYILNDQTHQALARVFPISALRLKTKGYQGPTGKLEVLSHIFLSASGFRPPPGLWAQDVGAFGLSFSGNDRQCLK